MSATSAWSETRFTCPLSLDALAALRVKTGQVDEAHRLYAQAEGVIDQMIQRVPGAYTESSLLSEMSDT